MGNEKKAVGTEAVLFKRLYGVKPGTFQKTLSILQKEYDTLRQKGVNHKTDGRRQAARCLTILTGVPDDGQRRGGIWRL
jgi:hypothetical protein